MTGDIETQKCAPESSTSPHFQLDMVFAPYALSLDIYKSKYLEYHFSPVSGCWIDAVQG
jgi:hypothetical protein